MADTRSLNVQPPPPYIEHAELAEDLAPQIASLQINDLSSASLEPNTSKVICHLKLLFAIQTLRRRISLTEGLFGIRDPYPEGVPDDGSELSTARNLLRSKVPEKRWSVFVSRAERRFTTWWFKLQRREHYLSLHDMERSGSFEDLVKPKGSWRPSWMEDKLPPLDVLMVWHAFMLNPRAYLEDCLRQGRMNDMW